MMTPFQSILIGFAAGILFCGVIVSVVCGMWIWLVRERQRSLDEFHADRDTAAGSIRPQGNRSRFSLKPERTKNDG
jgi:hypothetical protein